MCDDLTEADNEAYLSNGAVSRRHFAAIAGAAGIVAVLPRPADAQATRGRDVSITTADGTCDGYWVAPAKGKHPAVLVWPDIYGLRPAFRQMADRLASSGYSVLVVNQFYRSTRTPFIKPGETLETPGVREKIMPWRALLTPDATKRDAAAFVAWIDKQPQTDTKRGLATTGYCMGGPMVLYTAGTQAKRVRAGASFHGGGLATDKPDSPHLLIPQMKGGYLIAVAQNDDARNPQEKETLRTAFAAAKVPAEIEVYPAQHGWCPPDSKVYDATQAEKAWARQLALFKQTL
ncbi:dienelactone hydrolase family protein [Roseomonas aeriglobus]|nr:dienelactone hydrolase family protein [Roseomonas aeriglobus]